MHKFTERQLELGRLIEEGLTYNEIAERMGISPRTAKSYTDVLRHRLGVTRKRQIPHVMRELGLFKK